MFSWIQDQCRATRSMSFPSLKSKKSQASFKPKAPTRARALSTTLATLKQEPRVCHAVATSVGDVTLHQSIPFRTVCQAIRDAAFGHGNDLPVIISLEVHANLQQQEKMVEIMKDEWGGLLLTEPLPHCDPDKDQPTLRDLRKKILIKVKTAPVHPTSPTNTLDLQNSITSNSSTRKSFFQQNSKSSPTSERFSFQEKGPRPAPKRQIHESLQKLAIYTFSPGHFKSFEDENAQRPGHIYSFGEEKIKTLHRTEHNGLFAHNQKFLARTYPEGLKSFTSSNPNYPTLFWRKGVQMVALNWQVWDTAMELNTAMFDNENGWVLKPPGYRNDTNPTSQSQGSKRQALVEGKKRLELTITVLAGQHLPTPQDPEEPTRVNVAAAVDDDFCPRVTCFLHVEHAGEREPGKAMSSKDETVKRTRPARTEQPDWGATGSRLHFPATRHVVEELSFVRYAAFFLFFERNLGFMAVSSALGSNGTKATNKPPSPPLPFLSFPSLLPPPLFFFRMNILGAHRFFHRFHVEHCRRGWRDRTAWACIRLDRLQAGYRLIKLKDDDGYTTDGVLLVKIDKKVSEESPRRASRRARTWTACKDEVSQLKSKWFCLG